ncbi:MAG: ABC transporter permease [Anaerolineae bacterium]|nr:ABC transporter permease [Anaerolineae bacterium]
MADTAITSKAAGGVLSLSDEKVRPESLWRMAARRFLRHRMAVIGSLILLMVVLFVTVGATFYSEDYANKVNVVEKFQPPSSAHPLGTDQVGRDILARVIYGGQISLMIGILSVTIAILLGTVVGLLAGFFRGWFDTVSMRFVEALLSIPTLILLLLLSRALAGSTATINVLGRQLSASVIAIVAIIGFTSWMGLSRLVRSLVLTLKEQDFVLSARALGARSSRIILVHILPNCIAVIVVSATLGVGNAIITEAYLSFLGFGVMPPTATWGNILQRAQDVLQRAWWMWMAPGALIVATVLAINFIGDGLRDALDPKMKM